MKRLFLSLVTVIAVLALVVAILAWMSWQPPNWYAPPDFNDPNVAKLADRAEYRFTEELHKIRPETEVWRIRIDDKAMNAWLSGRLEGWLTHDQEMKIPAEIHHLQVHVTDSGLWTYAEVEITQGTPRPLGIQWWVWVDDGDLYVEPIAIRLGKLPLPITLFDHSINQLREEVDEIEAVIPLLDDRFVEVQHILFENGAIVLTCSTKLSN